MSLSVFLTLLEITSRTSTFISSFLYLLYHFSNVGLKVVRNAFIMGCDMKPNGAWETKVVGCVTPGGTQIRSGQTAADTQGSFKCTKGADGVVRLEQV